MIHEPICWVPNLSRRRLISATVAAGGLLLLPGRSNADTIRELRGEVSINGRKASKKSRVVPGDTVITGAGAQAAFILGRDVFLVKENSRLETFGKLGDAVASTLRLVTGGMIAVFGKGPARQVTTAFVTLGIRGTGIYVEAHPNRSYCCTCYGTVSLRVPDSEESKLTVASHHVGHWVGQSPENGTHFSEAIMHGHSDEELIALEKLAGRVPPFVTPNEAVKDNGKG